MNPPSTTAPSVSNSPVALRSAIHDLVDEHEAARMLGYSVAGLRSRRYAGLPPVSYKLGGRIRYSQRDLAAWVTASRQDVNSVPTTEDVSA